MKRQHNPHLPPWHQRRPVVLDERYEDEVRQSSEKLERAYQRAQKRTAQAERRAEQARRTARSAQQRKQLRQLERELDERRAELAEYERMMQGSPAGAEHRGRESFRPVPIQRRA